MDTAKKKILLWLFYYSSRGVISVRFNMDTSNKKTLLWLFYCSSSAIISVRFSMDRANKNASLMIVRFQQRDNFGPSVSTYTQQPNRQNPTPNVSAVPAEEQFLSVLIIMDKEKKKTLLTFLLFQQWNNFQSLSMYARQTRTIKHFPDASNVWTTVELSQSVSMSTQQKGRIEHLTGAFTVSGVWNKTDC